MPALGSEEIEYNIVPSAMRRHGGEIESNSQNYAQEACSEVWGQWDQFLPGGLWAYRNTPHESTQEKPSFLLFVFDLKSPTEAALLPPDPPSLTDLNSYCEELILSLSTAQELAVSSISRAQKHYKTQYDRGARVSEYKVGDWVFVRFPEEETGKRRKLSRPWYGQFHVVDKSDLNLRVTKVYFPEDRSILVHQLWVYALAQPSCHQDFIGMVLDVAVLKGSQTGYSDCWRKITVGSVLLNLAN